ncbi:MAG: fluoride efflux transporter CrcB [Erythrobacter sp.]|nr:fluoride efflux transporter CrcB [Erythrobacter sp.]
MSTLSPLVATLHVAIGGGVGAALRYQIGRAMTQWLGAPIVSAFPFATLAVNAIGSLLMGILAGWLVRHGSENSEQLRLLLGVGVLGGFTTFSAFSLEMVLMIQRGQYLFASLYAVLSFALGISGLLMGFAIMRMAA